MSAAKQNWPRVKLGEVCEEIHERIASSEIAVDTYVTTDNMLKNCAGVSVAEYVPDGVGLVRYEKGDVLLANIRPYLKKLWRATHDGGCSSDVVVFRSRLKELSSEYLFAALSQDRFFDYVMLKPRGTKMPRGDRDWMKEFEFPLPPLPVQREIVARLERELGAVDELAKKFEELEQAAEAEFKAELAEEMGRLGQLGQLGRDADVAEVAVAEVPGVADVPLTPTRWAKLGEICETGAGGTPLRTVAEYYENGQIPWLRSGEVCQRDITSAELCITQAGLDNSSAKLFPANSVLVAMYGATAGQVGILRFESSTNQAICAILPSSKHIPEFLYYQLLSKQQEMMEQAVGGAQPNISQIKIRNLIVAIPPLPVQRAIVALLDAAKARKEALVSAAKRGREVAAVWRKSILKEAFE